MTPSKHFQHLQPEDRLTIASLWQQRQRVGQIARVLGRLPGTISRELRRNAAPDGRGYCNQTSQAQARSRRRQAARLGRKLLDGSPLWDTVCTRLRQYWSHEQIATELRQQAPGDRSQCVSHETIYATIHAMAKGELRRELIGLLRRGQSKRRPRSAGVDRLGQILDMLSIHVRPPEVEDRQMPGHWEGDLIGGLGKKMALHARLTESSGMAVYFCDPHSPWQRGSYENTNGLLRQFFPKGTELSVYSEEDLDHVSDLMNGRSCQVHDGQPSLMVYRAMLEQASSAPGQIH